jgi:hypothetical protein
VWRAEHAQARVYEVGGARGRALKALVRALEQLQALYGRVPKAYQGKYLGVRVRAAVRADFVRLREQGP